MTSKAPLAAVLALFCFGTTTAAQDWPNRPITLVVPFAAGGGIDTTARVQALALSEVLGQSVIVENIGAAGGTVGSARVAKSPPDGYTFLIGNSGTHAYSQSLYKKRPYDAAADFEPISLVSKSPRILIVRKDLPASNLQEFIAYAKANQAKMQYGSAGVGSERICRAHCSISHWGWISCTCPTVARGTRCRICSEAASTTCATRSRPALSRPGAGR